MTLTAQSASHGKMTRPAHSFWLPALLLLGLLAHVPARAEKIPRVHGTTFAGATVNLPEALGGKAGILVVGFSQGSRDAITGWGRRLADDFDNSPRVAFYEMPVLASVPRFLRGFVTGRIRAAVPDRGRSHFLPLTEDEPAWRSLVHYQSPNDAYILLVDGQGTVRWQTHGPATDAAYAALRQQIERLRPSSD